MKKELPEGHPIREYALFLTRKEMAEKCDGTLCKTRKDVEITIGLSVCPKTDKCLADFPLRDKVPNFIHGSYRSILSPDYSGDVCQLTDSSGKLRTVDGRKPKSQIDFILLSDGRLMFGVNHSALANGRSVRYAGTLSVSPSSGTVNSWNNHSGHYVPHPDDRDGIHLAKRALERMFSNMNFSNFEPA